MSADEELRLIAVMRSAQGGATISELCENEDADEARHWAVSTLWMALPMPERCHH